MDMVEIVARALRDEDADFHATIVPVEEYHRAARAALEAMRQVPEDVLVQGCAIPGVSLETGNRMWQAMITQALKEG